LRFDPAAASASVNTAAPKKSFLQRIVPGPPRTATRPKVDPDATPSVRNTPDETRVWVMRNGKPEAVPVKTGLGNGRLTEVSGAGLKEGDLVIVRTASNSAP
jgi:HlyD family secretion protein